MAELQELKLYPLTGLFDECHNIDLQGLISAVPPVLSGPESLRNLNNLWWSKATSLETLNESVRRLQLRHSAAEPDALHHRIILEDPRLFIDGVQRAIATLADLGAGPKRLFAALETLQIFCNVYTDTISWPFSLSLQEGLVVNELSSKALLTDALDVMNNPYLEFIEANAAPVIAAAKADLMWIVGQIKMSTFTMARLAREARPDCHISVIHHATEYYSLNKITKYLLKNHALFSVIDSIILDDFEATIPQLRAAVQHGHPLATVPNLIFSEGRELPAAERTIDITPYLKNADRTLRYNTHKHDRSFESGADVVDPATVVDVKLWPNTQCYWSSCNFCAINKKYQTLLPNRFDDAAMVADFLASLQAEGVQHFWSIDEAVPPQSLEKLADAIIEQGIALTWETRSKVDRNFTPEICAKLAQAGLREIRLGLESASTRVLTAMGKHPKGWSLELVENVVAMFDSSGISVHFPTIIGFPTETVEERQQTFDFLGHIVRKYPSVTFNINVLGFDVGSKLFERYEEFGITMVRWPTPAKYFLGNLLDWDSVEFPFDYCRLDAERNEVMRSLLYPWMPRDASLPVYIYYRLAETSRATLIWKAKRSRSGNWIESGRTVLPSEIRLSDALVIVERVAADRYANRVRFEAYDWSTHHRFTGGAAELELLGALGRLRVPAQLFEHMVRSGHAETVSEAESIFMPDLVLLLEKGIILPALSLDPDSPHKEENAHALELR
ncbi:MAG TPA: radical SAM protein [Allosphingosinicella sp.]|nr:radical SAM protein [Allosphingosinicella sp.]